MKELIKYDVYAHLAFENWEFETPSIHRKFEGPHHDKVWILVVDGSTDKRERSRLRYRLQGLEKALKLFITCDFILRTRQSLPYHLRQEFLAVDPPYIMLTEALSRDELQDRLIEVFDWPWVYGESGWVDAFKDKISNDVHKAKEALRAQFFRARSYLQIRDISKMLSNPDETRLLTAVSLEGIDLLDESVTLLSEALKTNTSLKKLKLMRIKILPWHAKKLSEALAFNTGLIALEIFENPFKCSEKYFAYMLETNTTLQSLSMRNNFADESVTSAFSIGLAKNKTLLHLGFWSCSLTDSAIEALLPGLQKNSTLISIDLSTNTMSSESTEKFFAALIRPRNPFSVIKFNYNKLSTRVAIFIADLLRNNYGLVSLELIRCDIPARGMKAILSALSDNTTLRSLDLSSNRLPKKVISHLCKALVYNTHLRKLGVKTNVEIDGSTASEKIETFFESLAQNRTLDSLRLSIHGFNEKAIMALTNYLQNNPSLRDLKLEPFLWGSGNQKMLAEALGHNDHLEELDYDDFIKKSSLAKINQPLEKNIEAHTLRREEFIYNLISLNHSSDLWKSLPLDIKLHIVNFLDFSGETDIGKSKEQIYGCAHFLFTHFSDCYAIIKTGKRVLILEETDLRARYHFRFFKPNEVEVETTRSGELRLITL